MSSELAIRGDQEGFTPKQIAALQQLGVKDASNADLAVFFHQAARSQLDPFARQIYMIGRKQSIYDPETRQKVWETKQTIQTAIDGYRVIAHRAARRDGVQLAEPEILWCGQDGVWHDVWIPDGPPIAAKATVLRDGAPFVAVAKFSEYCQYSSGNDPKPSGQWGKMPANQIAKCAEALALRKAFPQDLSGLYTEDEMAQADGEVVVAQAEEPQETSEEHDRSRQRRMFALFRDVGLDTKEAQLAFVQGTLKRDMASRADMTPDEVEAVIADLEAEQRRQHRAEPVDAEAVEGPMVPSGVNAETGEVADPWETQDGEIQ